MLSIPRPGAPGPMPPRGNSAGAAVIAPPAVAKVVAQDPVLRQASGKPPALDAYASSPIRKVAFYFGLAFLFERFGVLSEVLYNLIGTSGYILYIIGPPAILCTIATGGLRRGFRYRAPYYWMAFFGWMLLATPFSYWQGGSFARVASYSRFDLTLLFVAGGLAVNWKEIRLVFYTLAASAVVNLLTARFFMDSTNGRFSISWGGSIGNSNDLAAHLLFILPFLLWVTMDSKRNVFIRILLLGGIGYGLWVILGTASRGALFGVMAAVLFLFWRASMSQRFVGLLTGSILTVVLLAALPQTAKNRLASVFGQQHEEAEESSDIRSKLFHMSLVYTMQHPIFGVGPDQFSNYQSQSHDTEAKSLWHPTHCSWTQVSSECGIPALIFYVCGLGSAMLLINRIYRAARQRGYGEIANACLCYLLAMVGFYVAITFLSGAYTFYGPFMIGLAGPLSFAAKERMSAKRETAGFRPAKVAF
jgi:O-antigen ligase